MQKVVQDFLNVDDSRLYYEIAGDGEPVIFLHGGFVDSRMWDEQFDLFASRYRVIRYDQRRYGQSEGSSRPYARHQDLYELMRHLQIKNAHLVGHSGGGALALDFALVYPQMVSTLVLYASGVEGYDWSHMTESYEAPVNIHLEKGELKQAAEVMLRTWIDGPNRRPEDVNFQVRKRVQSLIIDLFKRSDDWQPERPLDPPTIERLHEINVPTPVLVGAEDGIDLLKISDLLVSQIAGSQKIVMPSVAHMMNMEVADVFNQAVMKFIEGHSEAKEI
ncbi:MAG: alpha/beta hydrolase [Chloroflexota bacterium]